MNGWRGIALVSLWLAWSCSADAPAKSGVNDQVQQDASVRPKLPANGGGAPGKPPTAPRACDGAVLDDCKVCGGHNELKDCLGVCRGEAKIDSCGVCGGNDESRDCKGECDGNAKVDCQGVCAGPAKVDCTGACNGSAERDCAGVCNGSTKHDCAGKCNGDDRGVYHSADADGDGYGDPTTVQQSCRDQIPSGRVTKNNDCDDKLFGCNEDCKHCRSDGQMGGARKISELSGGFGTGLEDEAYFGSAIASLGDVNGDGVADLAVGAPGTISAPGVLWIVFLQADGSVLSKRKLNAETLELGASFTGRVGASVAALGDLDSDGVPDLAVGAPMYSPPEDQPGPRHPGRVWILRLTREGGVKGSKILEAVNTECSQTFYDMEFGAALLGLGDIDADGIGDLAIGQLIMCKGNKGMPGGVIVHRLAADGSSRGIEVTDPELTFDGSGFGNRFGAALSAAGDVNGDGVPDLAIGSPEGGDSDPTLATRGNLWIALLNRTGAVTGQPIRLSSANLGQSVERPSAQLGRALAWLGDSDGNGLPELAIGMPESSEICLLERSDPMTAFKFSRWLSTRDQTIPVAMAPDAQLAAAITPIGDYNGDGLDDLAVGAPMADDGGQDRGALWLLSLTLDCGRAPARDCDGNAANGCETPIGTTENCGACRQNCMTLPHTAGERACRDGACTFACEAGFVDCNKRKPDGCELVTTPGFYPQSLGASCVNDRPVLRCADGYGDCNGRADDGCEVELLTSGLHCGACDQACGHIKGVAAECVSGQCRINAEQPQCDYGYVDCNENPSDGCEGCGTCSNLCGPDELCERGARDGDVPVCVGTSQCDSIRVGTCRDDSPCTTPLTTERDCGACGIGCGIWDYKRLCGLNDRGDGYTCR